MEQNRKPRDKSMHLVDTLSLTKEAKIYNGEKKISLTSGAGETGQPLVKELNQNTFKHHTHTKKTQNGLKI